MRHSRLAVATLLAVPAGILLSSCGVSAHPTVSGPCDAPASFSNSTCSGRCLASVTVCPTTAAPANGEVQFTATGNYTAPPWTVTPQTVQWGACANNAPITSVTVSSGGLAQCQNGANGSFSVYAYDLTECNAIGPCGTGCTIRGTAQLTCP
ncbi:MAG TPA: hypothetical protein VMD92_04445 [Acidobacteriaceae bacterium]|nr:hypothetical protein [Acidobacteriaceae bacterium]